MCLFLFWWSFRACFVSSHNICQKRVWFFSLYIFSCLLILKMCKLGAKTCYDYYLWVYLFKWGVFSSLFFQLISLYPTLWSVSLYMSMCALIDSICFLMSVLLISSRLDACINFCSVFANCCCHLVLSTLLILCVDLLYGELTFFSSLLDFLLLDKWLCFVVYFMFRFFLFICSSVIWFLLSVVRMLCCCQLIFDTVFTSFCFDFAAFSVVVSADAVVVEWIHCIKLSNAKPFELKIF